MQRRLRSHDFTSRTRDTASMTSFSVSLAAASVVLIAPAIPFESVGYPNGQPSLEPEGQKRSSRHPYGPPARPLKAVEQVDTLVAE